MKTVSKGVCAVLSAVLLCSALGCERDIAKSPEPAEPNFQNVVLPGTQIPKNAVLLTVNGKEITADLYYYWLNYSIDYLEYYGGYQNGLDWSDTIDGLSVADYLKNDVLQTIKLYHVVEEKALEYSLGLTEEQKAELEQVRQDFVDEMGGEDAYHKKLNELFISDEQLLRLTANQYLFSNLSEGLFAKGGAMEVSDTELLAFAEQNGYHRAKYILFLTVDMTTFKAIPEAEKAAKLDLAKQVLARLRASKTPLELFDELMHQYSEDPELAYHPDGVFFQEGDGTTFEDTVLASAENEISDVVESEFGYYIVLTLSPICSELRDAYSSVQLDTLIQKWSAEARVKYTDRFKQVDPQRFYEARTLASAPSGSESPVEKTVISP